MNTPAPDTADFTCPFCRGQVTVLLSPSYGVAHAMPMCKKFEELEPLDFLHQANVKMGGHN